MSLSINNGNNYPMLDALANHPQIGFFGAIFAFLISLKTAIEALTTVNATIATLAAIALLITSYLTIMGLIKKNRQMDLDYKIRQLELEEKKLDIEDHHKK